MAAIKPQQNFIKAQANDIQQIIDMRLAFLEEEHGQLNDQQIYTIKQQLTEYFKSHLNNDIHIFICKYDEIIISTIFLLVITKPANLNFLTGKTGTILNVYTKPEYRKKGIASALLSMTLSYAKKLNLSAIDLKATQKGYFLYQKLGFTEDKSNNVNMKLKL